MSDCILFAEATSELATRRIQAVVDERDGFKLAEVDLSLRGEGQIEMKNSGPLLALFAERSRFLRWFNDALNVENVTARGAVRLGNGAVEVEWHDPVEPRLLPSGSVEVECHLYDEAALAEAARRRQIPHP